MNTVLLLNAQSFVLSATFLMSRPVDHYVFALKTVDGCKSCKLRSCNWPEGVEIFGESMHWSTKGLSIKSKQGKKVFKAILASDFFPAFFALLNYYLCPTKKVAFPSKIQQNPAKIQLNPRIFLWIFPPF